MPTDQQNMSVSKSNSSSPTAPRSVNTATRTILTIGTVYSMFMHQLVWPPHGS